MTKITMNHIKNILNKFFEILTLQNFLILKRFHLYKL